MVSDNLTLTLTLTPTPREVGIEERIQIRMLSKINTANKASAEEVARAEVSALEEVVGERLDALEATETFIFILSLT